MKTQNFITGETIDLRSLSPGDIEGNYVSWFNDEEVCHFNSHHVYPYTTDQAVSFIEGTQTDRSSIVLAILSKDSGKHIGNISLQKIDLISRNAEYAIVLGDRDYWGKGIAKEASLLILRHGFESLNLHRIGCGTSSENIPMQKLAAKLGFNEEGRRKDALYKNGKYVDIIEYGLLRKNFKFK